MIKYLGGLLFATLLLTSTSCSSTGTVEKTQKTSSPQELSASPPQMTSDKTDIPIPDENKNISGTVDSLNQFALSLYSQLGNPQDNSFFSPYSIFNALVITYAGAKNQTAQQMQQVLHLPKDDQHLHATFSQLTQQLSQNSDLKIANRLWMQKGQSYSQEFIDLLGEYYQQNNLLGIKSVDFSKDLEGIRQQINQWVADSTAHKIQELFAENTLTQQTKLVLANAVYFHEKWAVPFDKTLTQSMPFTLLDNKEIQTEMMQQKGKFQHWEDSEAQLLELPYRNGQLALVIILPEKGKERDFIKNEGKLKYHLENLKNLTEKKLTIYLPKWTLETSPDLKTALINLGMQHAFEPEKADFSGIDQGQNKLVLSDTIHKTFLEINEEGTQAAAATGVTLIPKGLISPPVEFKADHPFIFLIRDKTSNAILFLGWLTQPQPKL